MTFKTGFFSASRSEDMAVSRKACDELALRFRVVVAPRRGEPQRAVLRSPS